MMCGLRLPLLTFAICAAMTVAMATPTLSFTGELFSNSIPPGITGTGYWVTTGPVHLEWTVTQEMGGVWAYSYTLTVPAGDISHFILECSPNLAARELFDLSGDFSHIEINDYDAAGPGNSNPSIPGPIHGIKFDEVETTTAVFSFKTFRDPIWGDFYAKDGTAQNEQDVFNTAWNAGFLDADPMDPPSDGSINYHVLVPDTGEPIPDASTVILACVGCLPVLALRRRPRR